MIASTQRTKTEIFTFKCSMSHNVLFLKRKGNIKLLKSRLPFKKIANFKVKLLQDYK